jgi:hypothetical protein
LVRAAAGAGAGLAAGGVPHALVVVVVGVVMTLSS